MVAGERLATGMNRRFLPTVSEHSKNANTSRFFHWSRVLFAYQISLRPVRGPSRLLMIEQGELYWMLDVFIVAQVNKQKGPLWGPGIMSAASVVSMVFFFIQSFHLNAGQKRPAHPIQVSLNLAMQLTELNHLCHKASRGCQQMMGMTINK